MDDTIMNNTLAKMMLEKLNCHVTQAYDGMPLLPPLFQLGIRDGGARTISGATASAAARARASARARALMGKQRHHHVSLNVTILVILVSGLLLTHVPIVYALCSPSQGKG